MPSVTLRVLAVDDSADDVALLSQELRRGGLACAIRRVCTPAELRAALATPWDVVLSDWSMPEFDGLAAFQIMRELKLDLPFIIVSGTIDDEIAIKALKAGAHDFVNKDRLARLVPAIERELREAEGRRRQREADAEIIRQRDIVARSEAGYRAMFERSPLPMWTLDPESLRFVAVNDAAVRHYGYTREEFLGLRLADIWPGSEASGGRESASFTSKRVWRHQKKDGSTAAVEITASDIMADGRRLRLVLVNDVTERERPTRPPVGMWVALGLLVVIALVMALSTQRLVATMEQIDHTHRVIEELGTLEDRVGAGDAERPLASLRKEIESDLNPDFATQQQQLAELQRLVATGDADHARMLTGSIIADEQALLAEEHRDTSREVMYERLAEVTGTGLSVVILLATFIRLSRETRRRRDAEAASRRSEESLATTLQSIGDGVLSIDARGCVVRMNRVAEQLTGWVTAEAAGRAFAEVCKIVDADTRDAVLVARDGTKTAITSTTAPILASGRGGSGAVIVVRDASVERAAERKIAEANEELERRVAERTDALHKSEEQLRQSQKIEAIGRLAGGIAHDFNNVLSVILGYSEMLMSDPEPGTLPDEVVSDIREIHTAGQRAAGLTRQLLAFSRQQVLMPRVIDLNEVIVGLDTMLRRLIGADVELRTLPLAGGVRAKVDPGQIEQVIMNLVVNARDAMPRGGKLTIETRRVELDSVNAAEHDGVAPGHYVVLAVTDSGVGMTREIQARVFEPFFTTKDKSKGTGLGLATVHGIVRQSGGSIRLYSELGIGTTFKVYLPETRDPTDAVMARSPRVVARGTETILLVEDERQVRTLARGILARAGYQVLEACDGADALEVSGRFAGTIDLVLTDVVMPRISGRELVEKLTAMRPALKVLFMSGYTDDTIVHHGVLDREVAFVQKPLTPDTLNAKVREVLSASSSSK